jgi:predicted NAD-dependent protein-ADP-ribosyltransferase YbiA (DUF1768 family)
MYVSEGRRGSSSRRRRSLMMQQQSQFPYQMGSVNMAQSIQNLNALAQSGSGLYSAPMLTPQQQQQQLFQQQQQQSLLQQRQSMLYGTPMSASRSRGRRAAAGGTTSIQIPTSGANILSGPGNMSNGLGSSATLHNPGEKKAWAAIKAFLEMLKIPTIVATLKEFKMEPTDIMDTTVIQGVHSHADNKDKIFMFSDKPEKDAAAIYLSPELGVPIQVTEPVPAVYPSIIHYIEIMKIASLSEPALMGASNKDACSEARTVLSILSSQPSAKTVHAVADQCHIENTNWYKLEAERGRFLVYCWLGIWARYTQNEKMAAVLLATGNKLIIYDNPHPFYGNGDTKGDDQAQPGMNVIGVLMMFMRAILKHKLHQNNNNPIGFFSKLVLPALVGVYKFENEVLKPKMDNA